MWKTLKDSFCRGFHCVQRVIVNLCWLDDESFSARYEHCAAQRKAGRHAANWCKLDLHRLILTFRHIENISREPVRVQNCWVPDTGNGDIGVAVLESHISARTANGCRQAMRGNDLVWMPTGMASVARKGMV